jgi:hypothetical protein
MDMCMDTHTAPTHPPTHPPALAPVLVKMEGRPFAAGAMRECFALKKLSTFSSAVCRCVVRREGRGTRARAVCCGGGRVLPRGR